MAVEEFCLLTITVVEGEPFKLPEGAIVVATETAPTGQWTAKTHWRVVYLVRRYGG